MGGDGTDTQGVFRVRFGNGTRLRLLGNGGLGIDNSYNGSGVPQNGLRVSGEIQIDTLASAGSTTLCRNNDDRIATCSSNARYKEEIEALELGLDTVLALEPVAYRWTTDQSRDIGFVAEDIAAIDERLITRNSAGEVEGVRYGRLTAVLANAVQAMDQRQYLQSVEFAALHAENARLREQLAQLQSEQGQQHPRLEQELALLRDIVAPRLAQESP